MDPFKEATLHLMDSLERSLVDCQQAIDFAASLSQEYKNKSIETKALSSQIELTDWGEVFFKNVLSEREDISTIESWIRSLKAGKEFFSQDQLRNGAETSFAYKRKKKDLLVKALDDAWDKREFSLIERIGKLGVYKSMCNRHKNLVSMIDCIGIDFFSKESEMALYLDFGERYGVLAEALVEHLKKLNPEFNFSSIGRDLTRNFFGTFGTPIWSKCSNELFYKNFDKLNQEIDNLLETSEQFKRWEIERNIKNILKDCRQ
ncbi:MAG: hypothetical protein AB8G05_01860 [Oligoflexales bacterium]